MGILFFLGTTLTVDAQVEMPRNSPMAMVSYNVGLTEITITYSAPAVRERKIFGKLVPYGEVWRAGANEATTIEFSRDLNLEGNRVPAGKYALFIIPKKEGDWTIILNEDADQWGAMQYDESKDVMRAEVPTKKSKVVEERLNYAIVDQDIDAGYIRMGWNKSRVYMRFRTFLEENLTATVEKAVNEAEEGNEWLPYAAAADFYKNSEDYLDQAMNMVNKAAEIQKNTYVWWTMAQIQAKKEEYQAAVNSATEALEYGQENPDDRYYSFYGDLIKEMAEKWRLKI